MIKVILTLLTLAACRGTGTGDDTGADAPSADPRSVLCSVFADDHTGFVYAGGACAFAVDDIDWVMFGSGFDAIPGVRGGWECDPNSCGSVGNPITKIAADTFQTGASRWVGDLSERGVAVYLNPLATDTTKQRCIWMRCL